MNLLSENKIVLNEDIHEFDKDEPKYTFRDFLKEVFGSKYKKLWEEQNKLLDEQKLELRKKDKQIARLKRIIKNDFKDVSSAKK